MKMWPINSSIRWLWTSNGKIAKSQTRGFPLWKPEFDHRYDLNHNKNICYNITLFLPLKNICLSHGLWLSFLCSLKNLLKKLFLIFTQNRTIFTFLSLFSSIFYSIFLAISTLMHSSLLLELLSFSYNLYYLSNFHSFSLLPPFSVFLPICSWEFSSMLSVAFWNDHLDLSQIFVFSNMLTTRHNLSAFSSSSKL